MQYVIIPVSGDITTHEAERIDLEGLYAGTKADTVEALPLFRHDDVATMWFDEDYMARHEDGDVEVNLRADWLVRHLSPGTLIGGPGICGDVVVTGGSDEDGETLGILPEWHAFLTDAATFEGAVRETA